MSAAPAPVDWPRRWCSLTARSGRRSQPAVVIDPFDPDLVQPCSVDLTVGASFRVFRNSRYPYIDVKQEMEDLTELVKVKPDKLYSPPRRVRVGGGGRAHCLA